MRKCIENNLVQLADTGNHAAHTYYYSSFYKPLSRSLFPSAFSFPGFLNHVLLYFLCVYRCASFADHYIEQRLTMNPIYGCLNATLKPITPQTSLKTWEDYIPTSTGLSTEEAFRILHPSLEEIEALLRAEYPSTSAWGVETTNLSLVIDPKLRMVWYPINEQTSSNAMYVRASYITATEIIFAYYLGQNHNAPVILTGTSGTGKTMFSNVFVWRLLSTAADINLQSAVGALNVSGEVSSGDQNAINPCINLEICFANHS